MHITWVEPEKLAAGPVPASWDDITMLKAQHIRVIVTLTEQPLTYHLNLPSQRFADLTTYHAPIDDFQAPAKILALDTVRYIRDQHAAGQRVYLHCFAGEGRTGTMLHVLYLADGLSLDVAKERVREAKPSSQFFMLSDAQQVFLESLAADLAGG